MDNFVKVIQPEIKRYNLRLFETVVYDYFERNKDFICNLFIYIILLEYI